MLSGLLKCGKCGSTMISTKKKVKGKEYRYYVCQTYHKHGRDKCSQISHNPDLLEERILESYTQELLEHLKNSENLNHEIQGAIESRLIDIENDILRVQRDTLNLIKRNDLLLEEQFIFASNELKKELDDLLNQKTKLERKLLSSKQLEDFNLAVDAIKSDDKESIKIALSSFIKEIIVNDNNIHISYNFK